MAEACVTEAHGTWMACDMDSIMVVATAKGKTVRGAARRPEESQFDPREFAPVRALSYQSVMRIARRFRSLNPYAFGGDLLKIEDINYVPGKNGKPTHVLRTVHGYAISAKRYVLMHKNKIVEAKGHGLGYLMSPAGEDEPDWIEDAWSYVLQVDHILNADSEPVWLDRPAMMKIPVSSPAVLGRLKGFCKPYDFVLAPLVRDSKLDLEDQAEKPILITRFNRHSEEWPRATYYNARSGKECHITTGEHKDRDIVPVKTYRQILNLYLLNPEVKFNAADGQPCTPWTRGVLQRRHITAEEHNCCGKEFRRKLEEGPVDHDTDFKVKVYESGRVGAEPGTLRVLAKFSERDIAKATGLSRNTIRQIRRGEPVTRTTFKKVIDFLKGANKRLTPSG